MGIFDKVTDFLSKPVVRGVLAGGSALGGMGAFEDLDQSGSGGTDWNKILTTGFGIGNIASAASSGDALAIPQAALGAYGALQNNQIGGIGNFGTFGDSYDRVMAAPKGFGSGVSAFFKGGSTAPAALSAAKTAIPAISGVSYGNAAPTPPPVSGPYQLPPPNGWDLDSNYGQALPDAMTMGGRMSAINTPSGLELSNAGKASEFPGQVPSQITSARSGSSRNLLSSGGRGQDPRNLVSPEERAIFFPPPQNTPQVSGAVSGGQVGDYNIGNTRLIPPNPTQAAASVQTMVSNKAAQNTQKAAGFSFERVFDNAVSKMMENPLEAVSVGAAVISMFTDTRDEDAAAAYAAEMARYRQRLDPSSSFAQEWQGAYIQDKTDELNKQFAKAEADLSATMARRGMTDSTVNAAARSSLARAKAELAANFKSDAYVAYATYQKQLIAAERYGSANAATAAKIAGGTGANFQNTLKAATSAVAS
ncbi:MAG: hypothetical protein Unbinned1190contig1000_49 [Prokaryotic dsDNA virus sp.]|nr:MAG: hypothetical protein Unbinned1190contig1000_49 [Prokaryotic dsDNA virus sp.]|tara:strand:- start:6103 stop:7536 length:1434 start_codon:yes stop_codon:yes gene_type:complete